MAFVRDLQATSLIAAGDLPTPACERDAEELRNNLERLTGGQYGGLAEWRGDLRAMLVEQREAFKQGKLPGDDDDDADELPEEAPRVAPPRP